MQHPLISLVETGVADHQTPSTAEEDSVRLSEALRLSERRFDLLFDTNPLPMWIYDLGNYDFLAANEAAVALFGYSGDELLAMKVQALWPAEQKAELEREVARPRGAGYVRVGICTRMHRDGRRIQAELYSHDMVFKGRTARLIIARDVTRQLRSERMLARGTRALEMLAARASLAEVLDELCRAVEAEKESESACYCTVLLHEHERLVAVAAPHLPEAFVQAIEQQADAEDAEGFIAGLALCDAVVSAEIAGDPMWGRIGGLAGALGLQACWTVPIASAGGAVIGMLTVFYEAAQTPTKSELDFGKRMAQIAGIAIEHERADQALRSLNADLERRVALRTAELEAANQELEHFSSAVAHDLRAPLRAIAGYSALLSDDHAGQLDAQGTAYVRRIDSVAKRMAEMIESLLQLARLSRGALRRDRVDLSAIATLVSEELASIEPGRRVEFRIEAGIAIEADRELMHVVLQNLIGNAWKFTRKKMWARIEFGRLEDDAGTAFFVRDNGAGFDMRYSGKLFKPFERLHGASEYEGSGIGLATVRRIIHRHGGRIWGLSKPGEGATFFFAL